MEMIITDQRKKGRKGRYVVEYLTRFKGYNADLDKWLNSRQLRNAPEVLEVWHKKWKLPGSHYLPGSMGFYLHHLHPLQK